MVTMFFTTHLYLYYDVYVCFRSFFISAVIIVVVTKHNFLFNFFLMFS